MINEFDVPPVNSYNKKVKGIRDDQQYSISLEIYHYMPESNGIAEPVLVFQPGHSFPLVIKVSEEDEFWSLAKGN